ncbi:hypothetical protein Sru01_29370 [Sphaerisporangium rufum]|uniref:Pentapeptide repeat-containing protein n=1 Tax=Sphaerisporangium rufum TaxID=1381558 RepID=A0A919V554_9ACTN|nr:pentapeptide repeat-containing protein [Sphaerisporangium rufum]GII77955.1 hypothetical protein Sru01_29370 [Sphaerisporangium rufum]
MPASTERARLSADCGDCFALCCVAPAFAASADFAVAKPAGSPCANLRPDFRCGIHTRLRAAGFKGCTVYDCFGAGQQVSRHTFAGRDWRAYPEVAADMFAVFPVMRDLHELLWYLTEALELPAARPVHRELRAARDEVDALTGRPAAELLALDVSALRVRANPLLLRASELARTSVRRRGRDHRGADLAGARLAGADLRGASLRGACLIGADLRRADLRSADLTGADLRDADVRGADLTGALFLLRSQLDAARGDATTVLPPSHTRPAHW